MFRCLLGSVPSNELRPAAEGSHSPMAKRTSVVVVLVPIAIRVPAVFVFIPPSMPLTASNVPVPWDPGISNWVRHQSSMTCTQSRRQRFQPFDRIRAASSSASANTRGESCTSS